MQSIRRQALRSSGLLLLTALSAAPAAAHAQQATYRFNIPAEDLGTALRALGRIGGQQLAYSSATVSGKTSAPVVGAYSVDDALRLLLTGSGVSFRRGAGGVVVIYSIPQGSRNDAGADTAAQTSAGLDTVVVTAQKRRESSQNVPITMTVLSSEALETNRVESLSDVSRLAPGVLISAFSFDSPTIAIRGASNTFVQIGVSKPVAIVVDDVFVERPSASVFKLSDLDSIDILEGPQGTLFGRNVSGGAIVIETRQPRLGRYEFQGEVTGGNYGDNEYDGVVNVPIAQNIAANLNADYQKRDGYGQDRLTGAHEDGIDSQNYRGNILFQPQDDLRVTLSAHYSYDKNNDRTLSSTSAGDDGDPRTSDLGVNQYFARTLSGEAARVVWNPPQGTVTSISAYERVQSGEFYSGVAANYAFLAPGQSQSLVSDKDQVGDFTEELRYASPKWSFGDFVAGVFYLHEDGDRELGSIGLAAKTGAVSSDTIGAAHVITDSYAGFIDATLHLPRNVDLSAGVRYTVDDKTADFDYVDLVQSRNNFTASGAHASFSQATPRVVLNWRPWADKLFYASIAEGFTAGGFNTNATSAKAFAQTFNPEVVTNYEIGAKTQWLDNRLRLNASLYEEKFHNKQELLFNSLNGILDIVNAASATAKGFELTGAAKATRWLELDAGFSRLIGKYDSFVLGSVNYTGHPLSSSPPNRFTVGANLNYPLDYGGYLIGSANYSWTDSYNTGAAADPRLEIPHYGLTNLDLGYETQDRHYRVSVWVKNLADTRYVLTNSTQVVTGTYLGEPRTVGVTLRAKY